MATTLPIRTRRHIFFKVLQAGSAANVKVKMEFVMELKAVEQILLKVSWKKMAESLAAKQLSRHSLIAGIRQTAKTFGFQLTKRKALQIVPVLGAIVGASLNGALANDVGNAAYMSYRRRWIAEQEGRQLLPIPSRAPRRRVSTKKRPAARRAAHPKMKR